MIRTGPTSGLNSDFVTSSMYIGDSLPEGLRLGEYEILSVIGEGGFGIVYLAYDHFLQRQVALKEYMPSSLAGRARMSLDVTIKSERHRDTFMAGLKSFINEARLLAQFDHRALVKVYRFWEGNGTAYMVMPYVVGPTLKAALAEMPGPPDEAWLRGQVLTPLMEALSLLHKASCLHRDIAPDNILLTETGPMLLDFGAARKVIGDLNQTLTVVLKPGYAPIEQYGEVPALTQGPWTDVYALGGVVRYAITGKVPVSATTRLVQDTMVPLAELATGRYGEAFLRAVDATLAVRPLDRPQDMAQFAALLEGGPAAPAGAEPVASAVGMGGLTGEASPRTGWPHPLPQAPVTRAPTTPSPTTQAPLAQAPISQPHVTQAHVTQASATVLPTTQAMVQPPASPTPPSGAGHGVPDTGAVLPAPEVAPSLPAQPFTSAGPAASPFLSASPSGQRAAVIAASAPKVGRWLALGAGVLLLLGAAAWWFLSGPVPGDAPKAADTPSTTDAAPPASAAVPVAAPPVSATPSPVAPTTQADPARQPSSPSVAIEAPAARDTTLAAPPAATPPARPSAVTSQSQSQSPAQTMPPDRQAPARTASTEPPVVKPSTVAPAARPAAGGDKAARCSDLLQKASLEPLSPSETSFLKTECK